MENDYTQKNGLPNQAEAEKSAVEAPLPAGIQIGISSKIGTRKYQQDSIVVMDGKRSATLIPKNVSPFFAMVWEEWRAESLQAQLPQKRSTRITAR